MASPPDKGAFAPAQREIPSADDAGHGRTATISAHADALILRLEHEVERIHEEVCRVCQRHEDTDPDELVDPLYRQMDEREDRITRTPAATLAGLAAKARLLRRHLPRTPAELTEALEPMAASLADDIERLAAEGATGKYAT